MFAEYCCEINELNSTHLQVIGVCVVTGVTQILTVSTKGFVEWRSGSLIQDCLPELSIENREWLISGISAEGWDIAFSDKDEDGVDEVCEDIFDVFEVAE